MRRGRNVTVTKESRDPVGGAADGERGAAEAFGELLAEQHPHHRAPEASRHKAPPMKGALSSSRAADGDTPSILLFGLGGPLSWTRAVADSSREPRRLGAFAGSPAAGGIPTPALPSRRPFTCAD